MAVEVDAPCITKSPAPKLLIMKGQLVLVLHWEGFQLPALIQFWETIDNINLYFVSSNKCSIARVDSLVAYIRNVWKTGKQCGSAGAANEETKQYHCKVVLTITGQHHNVYNLHQIFLSFILTY